MPASFRWFLIAIFCSPLGADSVRAGWHHRRAGRRAPMAVWQPIAIPECGGWAVPAMASDMPMGMEWHLPGGGFIGEPFFEPHLLVATFANEPDSAGCCRPAAECCDPGWSEHLDGVLVESADGLNALEWEHGVEDSPVTAEIVVLNELVGETVSLGEVFAGDPGQGDDVVGGETTVEILPTVRDEEVRVLEGAGGDPLSAGEAGSSVLVEPAAPLAAPAPVEPTGEPVIHDPLRMDAPNAVQPVEPEAGPVVPLPEQVSPPAPPEPVNIFEAEEGGEASLEPARRWIHARGDRSLVARLVDMPDAETCLLETAGRQIRVPLGSLSQHDQSYVHRAGERLAATRAAAKPGDTAGL